MIYLFVLRITVVLQLNICFSLLNLFSCLYMTSEVQDIPEAYMHLIYTEQYYTLQYIYICL